MITYSDIIDRVSRIVYSYGASYGVSASQDQIRTAIADAYHALPLMGSWRRYQTSTRISANGSQSGTATYSSGTLTLDSDTWPSWAENCSIDVNGSRCVVESIDSNTVITLRDNPANCTDDTEYTYILYHDAHQLPSDFVSPLAVFSVSQPREIVPTTPVVAWRMYGGRLAASLPTHYVIERADYDWIRLIPPPTSASSYDIHYRRSLTPLVHSGRDEYCTTGTISVSGKSVTGSGTEFSSDMEGAVLRIGRNSSYIPTDSEGFSPYVHESIIGSVTSASVLTLETSIPVNYSDVAYCITSKLDVDYHMYQLLVALTIQKLSQMLGREIPIDVNAALKQALAADQLHVSTMGSGIPKLVYSMTFNNG